jgi:hypothetical protein
MLVSVQVTSDEVEDYITDLPKLPSTWNSAYSGNHWAKLDTMQAPG